MTKRIDWTADVLQDLYERKCNGASLKDLVALLFSKQGVEVTPAAVSIQLKKYRQQMGFNNDAN